MKAVLIGIDLDNPYDTSKWVIRQYEGWHCVSEANHHKGVLVSDKQDRREYAVLADRSALEAWVDQQPHL